jgi:hypothetical protein
VFGVPEGGHCPVWLCPDRFPETPAAAEKAQVVHCLRVVFGLAFKKGIARPECAVAIPDRIKV